MTYRPIDISGLDPVPPRPQDRPDLAWVPIISIVIDDRYQRPLGEKNWRAIRRIAEIFDWAEFTPCLVAPLGGGRHALIDGQHRTHAALLAGHAAVPCLIVPMEFARQARAFAAVNGRVTAISMFHIYRAALASGEPWAVESCRVVEAAGCRLMTSYRSASQKKPREIYCVGLVRGAIEAGHHKVVGRLLAAICACRDAEDIGLYQASFLGPFLSVLIDTPGLAALDLVAFMDECSAATLERAVSRMRDQPTWGRKSHKVLMAEAIKLRLVHWARGRAA